MSMLDRYRKSGGFVQLLTLLETCGPAKQERFLEIIRTEDPRWADAIRTKMLDMNRIYKWNDETLAEVIGSLQDLTVAIALHGADETLRSRIQATFSHSRRRKIEDLFQSSKPSPQEISAMHVKIIETVRKMALDGSLRFDKFDPDLAIEENIEDKLARSSVMEAASTVSHLRAVPTGDYANEPAESAAPSPSASGNEVNESRVMEIQTLKKRIADLSKENAMLRHELSLARSKLDQIKKIA